MKMEENKKILNELLQGWKKLNIEIKTKKKVDMDLFKDMFARTYSLLSDAAEDDKVSKESVEIVAEAYLFANTENKMLDSKYLAALVLTERMLNCYAFSSAADSSGVSTVYILDLRKEVKINFNNVSESMNLLESAFEANYWNNFSD